MSKRAIKTCAYCGGVMYWKPGTPRPKNRCNCKYRHMRMGSSGCSVYTTSRAQTIGGLIERLREIQKCYSPKVRATWTISYTILDKKKIAEADAKRAKHAERKQQ